MRALRLIAALALAASLVGCGNGPTTTQSASRPAAVPLADPGLTPKGWAPVELGAIQVSVPSAWLIEDPGFTCSSIAGGQVFIREPARLPSGTDCPTATDVVTIDTTPHQPIPNALHRLVNGVPAVQGRSGSSAAPNLMVRALGVQVDARGPLAARVLATLTYSPLSVVLDSTVNIVPPGWRHVSFGGLRFAVPASWATDHQPGWPGCPYNIEPNVLLLQRANSLDAPGCPGPPSTAGYDAARAGLVVAAGPVLPATPPGARCRTRGELRLCVDPPPSGGGDQPGHELSLLTAHVDLPGHAHPDQIEIGLAGTGLQALDIFDSIAPAPSGTSPTSPPTITTRRPCLPLAESIVTDVNHLGSDARLGQPRGTPTVTCTQAIRDDPHPSGNTPVIGARLMTFTSVRYPTGRLVWVLASTPGLFISNGGPPEVGTKPSTTSSTTPHHYKFSIDLIDAKTGHWLEGIEGS